MAKRNGYRLEFFNRIVVDGEDLDYEIDTENRVVRMRNGLTANQAFAVGENFAAFIASGLQDELCPRGRSRHR